MKYNEETVKQIITNLETGLTAKQSSHLAGISEDTFYTWKKQKSDFSESVMRAKAVYIKGLLDNITTASAKDWKASAWLLERLNPEEFSLQWMEKHPQKEKLNIALVEFVGGKYDENSKKIPDA